MPDYHKMYLLVFNELTRIVEITQDAQSKAEEIFVSAEDTPIAIVGQDTDTE